MAKSTPHPRKWEAKGVNSRMYWKSLYLQEVRIRPVEAECHSLETEVAGNPLSNLAYRTALDIVALQRYCGSAHPPIDESDSRASSRPTGSQEDEHFSLEQNLSLPRNLIWSLFRQG